MDEQLVEGGNKKKRKKVFLEKSGNNIIVDTSIYEDYDGEEFRRMLFQTKNPSISIDLILSKRIGEAYRTEDVPTAIKTQLTKLVNSELTKDTKYMPDKIKKKVKKISRKLKRGERPHNYPDLHRFFPPIE